MQNPTYAGFRSEVLNSKVKMYLTQGTRQCTALDRADWMYKTLLFKWKEPGRTAAFELVGAPPWYDQLHGLLAYRRL